MSCAVTRMRPPDLRTLPSRIVRTASDSAIRRMSWSFPRTANADVRAATFSPGICDQRVDDFLGQPVAEILVVFVPAHVGERQHRRWTADLGRFRRQNILKSRFQFGHALKSLDRLLRQAS